MSPSRRRRSRRLPLVTALLTAGAVSALLVMCGAPVVSESPRSTAATPYLPVDTAPATGGRMVFAHYMPNFPISIDNLPAATDYYTTQYLNPLGENGVHAAYGGWLRNRPMARTPSTDSNWRNVNVGVEIDQARSIGIDGFAVDTLVPRTTSTIVNDILSVAATKNFKILITMDMNGPVATQSQTGFVNDLVSYAKSPAAMRLADGRVVISTFRAEAKSVLWWKTVLMALKMRGVNAAFYPMFLDPNANLDQFAPISYGMGYWGGRNADSFPATDTGAGSPVNVIKRAQALGKSVMSPVAFGDSRPRDGMFDESRNAETLRDSWRVAREQNVNWVQIMTWNDYAENTSIAPSAKNGYRLLDLFAYYVTQFRSNADPAIARDVVYLTHRTQMAAAKPVFPETKLMTARPGSPAAVDQIEVTTFTRGPSIAAVTVNGKTNYCDVPAGVSSCAFALEPGPVSAGIYRDGSWVALTQSPNDPTATPTVQDMQYVVDGGLR